MYFGIKQLQLVMGQNASITISYLQKLYKIRLIITSTYQSFLKLILLLEKYQKSSNSEWQSLLFLIHGIIAHQIFKQKQQTNISMIKYSPLPDSLEWKWKHVPFLVKKNTSTKCPIKIKHLSEWLVYWN